LLSTTPIFAKFYAKYLALFRKPAVVQACVGFRKVLHADKIARKSIAKMKIIEYLPFNDIKLFEFNSIV